MAKSNRLANQRKCRGSFIAELPLVLWIFFMVLAFPLLNLSTAFLRVTFLYCGIHMASWSAARANTYLTAVDGKPSATDETNTKIGQVKNAFSGIDMQNIKTEILETNITTLTTKSYTAPLAKAANQSENSYQIQVTADCIAQPFFPMPSPMPIAGVSAPLKFTLCARQYCENPQGLNL